MKNVEKIKPTGLFTNYIYKAIPLAFDESLSYYETLCGLLYYLKNTILPTINNNADAIIEIQNLMEQLQNYVDNYFKNLDVQQEINNKLDEMAEDGTLSTLLNNLMITKGTFRTKLYMNKIGRINITDYYNNGYASGQAGCYIGENNYVFPLIKNDATGSAKLIKINFETGDIVQTNDVEGLYHANGCCLKDNLLYYVQSFNNENVNLYNISVVNPLTLEVTNQFPINFNDFSKYQILGIGYDEKLNKFYLIGYDYFYVADTEFNVEKIVKFNHPTNKQNIPRQGGTFYEDYVCYVINNESAIVCFNRDGTLHHIINLGINQHNNVFGEIENINVINNVMYVNSNLNYVGKNNLGLHQFFYADLGGGGLPQINCDTKIFETNLNIEVIVNKTLYNTLSNFQKFTSDGSRQKPYETIGEAIANINNEFCNTIIIQDDSDYNQTISIYNRNLFIKGGGAKIKSLKIVNSRVGITSLTINHSESRKRMIGGTKYTNTPLYITYNSIVTLLGDSGINYDNCINDGMETRYIVEGSIFNDYSVNNTSKSITKLTPYSSESDNYQPTLLYGSILNTNDCYNINNSNIKQSYYKNIDPKTGILTINMNEINGFNNVTKGFDLTINFVGQGNSNNYKINKFSNSKNIIFESLNKRYLIIASLNLNTNILTLTPYTWNNETNTFTRDDEFKYYPYYSFDI